MSGITLIYPPGSEALVGSEGATARALITRAFMLCGTVADGETPGASLMEQGRAVLNDLVDEWRGDRLMLFTEARTVYALVADQAAYTLGVGGDFNQLRPVFVNRITILDPTSDPAYEMTPLQAFSDAEWAEVPMKDMTSTFPTGYTLDKGYPLMTVTFYPVPDNATYQAVLYTPAGILTSVSSLDTTIAVPPGLTRALRYALAAELSMVPGFSPAPRGDLKKEAALSIARFQSQNLQVGTLGCDDGLLVGWRPSFNWRTGE